MKAKKIGNNILKIKTKHNVYFRSNDLSSLNINVYQQNVCTYDKIHPYGIQLLISKFFCSKSTFYIILFIFFCFHNYENLFIPLCLVCKLKIVFDEAHKAEYYYYDSSRNLECRYLDSLFEGYQHLLNLI